MLGIISSQNAVIMPVLKQPAAYSSFLAIWLTFLLGYGCNIKHLQCEVAIAQPRCRRSAENLLRCSWQPCWPACVKGPFQTVTRLLVPYSLPQRYTALVHSPIWRSFAWILLQCMSMHVAIHHVSSCSKSETIDCDKLRMSTSRQWFIKYTNMLQAFSFCTRSCQTFKCRCHLESWPMACLYLQ